MGIYRAVHYNTNRPVFVLCYFFLIICITIAMNERTNAPPDMSIIHFIRLVNSAFETEPPAVIEVFANVGLVPDSGSSFFLPRLVGYNKAFELITLATKITAREAFEMGFIYKVANNFNTKTYIGYTNDSVRRRAEHFSPCQFKRKTKLYNAKISIAQLYRRKVQKLNITNVIKESELR